MDPPLPIPPPLPPLRPLSRLPTELKSRIAELAQEQDARFRDHWSSGERAGARLVKQVQTEWHGKSLLALSQTNKEWYEVAAKYRFRTLTAKQAGARYCRTRFIRRHGKLVRTLDLSDTSLESEEDQNAFDAFPLLSNVVELMLDWDNFVGVFGPARHLDTEPEPEEEYAYGDDVARARFEGRAIARQNLREASGLRVLRLFNVYTSGLHNVLVTLPHLTSLHISWDNSVEIEDDFFVLRSLENLRHLTFDYPYSLIFDLTPWKSPLLSLNILKVVVTPTTYAFIDLFASSLHSLHLQFSSEEDDQVANKILPPSPIFASPFPKLESLHLENVQSQVAGAILASLVPPNSPPSDGSQRHGEPSPNSGAPLSNIRIELTDELETEAGATLKYHLERIDTLRSLRVVQGREELGTLGMAGQNSANSPILARETLAAQGHTTSQIRANAASWNGDQRSAVANELSALLEFAEGGLRGAIQNEDNLSLLAMQEALGEVKGLQLLQQD